jgi:hypothetical protein
MSSKFSCLSYVSVSKEKYALRQDESTGQYFAVEANNFSLPIFLSDNKFFYNTTFMSLFGIAVSNVKGVNTMLLRYVPNNSIHNMTFDRSWNYVSSGGYYVIDSFEFRNFDISFEMDLKPFFPLPSNPTNPPPVDEDDDKIILILLITLSACLIAVLLVLYIVRKKCPRTIPSAAGIGTAAQPAILLAHKN